MTSRAKHNIVATGDVRLLGEAFVGASAAIAAPGDRGGSAGATLEAQSWQRAEAGLRGGQTALLDARTNAVVEHIRVSDDDGAALIRYAEALVGSSDAGTLGRHLARLQRGDDLSHTPEDRFGQNVVGGSTPEHQANAARLGYGVGAVSAAFGNRGNAIRSEASDLVEVAGYVVPGVAEGVIQQGVDVVVGARIGGLDRMREVLEDGSAPVDAAQNLYGNEVQRVYVDERDRIVSLPINNPSCVPGLSPIGPVS